MQYGCKVNVIQIAWIFTETTPYSVLGKDTINNYVVHKCIHCQLADISEGCEDPGCQ